MRKQLSREQISFAFTLKERYELDIPFDLLCDYEFGKKFIDLFNYVPNENDTGWRRFHTIIDYLYYDKDQRHLQFKLDLSAQEVAFMVSTISLYKFKGNIPRENLHDKDPELTAYQKLENALYDHQ